MVLMSSTRGTLPEKRIQERISFANVNEIILNRAFIWKSDNNVYRWKSCGSHLRDKNDSRKHWTKKICGKFEKPTKKMEFKNASTLHCQRVQQKILENFESASMGADPEEED